MKMDRFRLLSFAAVGVLGGICAVAPRAQTPAAAPPGPPPQSGSYTDDIPKPPYKRITGPQTLNPGDWPQHWPYPDEYDSAVGASEVHHIFYVDSHVRFVQVAYFAGVHGQMHGHPWPSVFAVDAPSPKSFNVNLDADRRPIFGIGGAPKGRQYPLCNTMGPQAPHAETNQDTWPHLFYRLEFLRFDGDGFQQHWKEWYPRMLDPLLPVKDVKPAGNAPKFSKEWPYPIAYDSVLASPNTHKLLYEDDHLRLVEVTIRPGETENTHGDPYPSVLAYDTPKGSPPDVHRLDPGDTLDGQDAYVGASLAGFDGLSCSTTGPVAPHAVHNPHTVPIHFYRIEFKRIDGDGLRTHWREWYPKLAKLTDEYAAHPYVLNY